MTYSNIIASIQARLLNLAKASNQEYQRILTRYALERFLYRLSISEYADSFTLKGALLFDLWFDVPLRPTRDIDLLGFGSTEAIHVIQTFQDICRVPYADGLTFDADSVTCSDIRAQANYPGLQVSIQGKIGNSRCNIRVDIGYGDAVTPKPEFADYPVLLDNLASPKLLVYPRYTVVAEKIEAIIKLGSTNSRMKDYFDLWIMQRELTFDPMILRIALEATLNRRGTPMPAKTPMGLSDEFAADNAKQTQWKSFLKRNALREPTLEEAVKQIRNWISPLLWHGNTENTLPKTTTPT